MFNLVSNVKSTFKFSLACTLFAVVGCGATQEHKVKEDSLNSASLPAYEPVMPARFYAGADMSYVNEMEDCGVTYRVNGETVDGYKALSDAGSNLVRVRLWHNPTWTQYSDLKDAKETIRKAKALNQTVLLDFHYSDTWADPEKQFIPAAWEHLIDDTPALGDALSAYTTDVLTQLKSENLLPDMVQVGNETNAEILQLESKMKHGDIDWTRNAYLLNRGLAAVTSFNEKNGTNVERVLHIAQPENALWWFADATQAGIADYDIIAISYYSKWSTFTVDTIGAAIAALRTTYNKDVIVVETAYPWGMGNFDNANNVLDESSLTPGYPGTPEGQKRYMMDLSKTVMLAGGIGVVVWEPAWVSSKCKTLWGTGSHWENTTFFHSGKNNEALPALEFYSEIREFYKKNIKNKK